MTCLQPWRQIKARALDIAVYEAGPVDGMPMFLMHGSPHDIHACAEVAPLLADQGYRVYPPCLRECGATRFLNAATPQSGEQAGLTADLLALMDALAVPRAVPASCDRDGRAARVVAALWPERCAALISLNSDKIRNIEAAMVPDSPENERSTWYQYYFRSARGRAGLTADRRGLNSLLWNLWSPQLNFDLPTCECSASAFDNADFVDVVIHSYRRRFGLMTGNFALTDINRRQAAQPPITVPSITFNGADNVVCPPARAGQHARRVTGPRCHRRVPDVSHNLLQEVPQLFAEAVLERLQQSLAI